MNLRKKIKEQVVNQSDKAYFKIKRSVLYPTFNSTKEKIKMLNNELYSKFSPIYIEVTDKVYRQIRINL